MRRVKQSQKPQNNLNMKMAGKGVRMGTNTQLDRARCASSERLDSHHKQCNLKNEKHHDATTSQ